MIRNGRPVDQDFQRWHELYYRFESEEDMDGDRLLGPRLYASFDISVNWSKYSKPWDVIFDFPEAGIALFFVRHIWCDLPVDRSGTQREQDRPKPHQYRPWHEPEENNYSHSVIAVLKDNERVTKSASVGKIAKKEFKQIISDNSLILHRPRARANA
jgi:hypothetical protein